LDEAGKSIKDFDVDDCVYINEDSTLAEVEWMNHRKDVSPVAGKTVQMVFRGRGAKLYSLQFVEAK
jgi:hypothetical protein